ncbi:secreted protein [Beggiatoa sp. PS]|nr:secreted protein [Beggiatoa sp. PS]
MKFILKINLLMISLLYSYQTLATNTKISITGDFGFSIMDFSYKEFKKNGQLFNHEYGTLPGLKIGMMKNFKQGFFSTTFSYHLNDVNYKGETQSGMPLKTRTDEKFFDFSFLFGRRLKNNAPSYLSSLYRFRLSPMATRYSINCNRFGFV